MKCIRQRKASNNTERTNKHFYNNNFIIKWSLGIKFDIINITIIIIIITIIIITVIIKFRNSQTLHSEFNSYYTMPSIFKWAFLCLLSASVVGETAINLALNKRVTYCDRKELSGIMVDGDVNPDSAERIDETCHPHAFVIIELGGTFHVDYVIVHEGTYRGWKCCQVRMVPVVVIVIIIIYVNPDSAERVDETCSPHAFVQCL